MLSSRVYVKLGSMNCGHEMDQQNGHLMGKKKDGLQEVG